MNISLSKKYYNLGLQYKYQQNWRTSIEFNLKAIQENPSNDPAYWNLGIAYTAIGDFRSAATMWKHFNVETDSTTGISINKLGIIPIRLHNGEVVWCDRLDPARAQINIIPLPESNHRYNDILLNDGSPDGCRRLNGVDVPVFNELAILKKSKYITTSFTVEHPSSTLQSYLARVKHPFIELWSDTVNPICPRCSRKKIDTTSCSHRRKTGYLWFGIATETKDEIDDFVASLLKETGIKRNELVVLSTAETQTGQTLRMNPLT